MIVKDDGDNMQGRTTCSFCLKTLTYPYIEWHCPGDVSMCNSCIQKDGVYLQTDLVRLTCQEVVIVRKAV